MYDYEILFRTYLFVSLVSPYYGGCGGPELWD